MCFSPRDGDGEQAARGTTADGAAAPFFPVPSLLPLLASCSRHTHLCQLHSLLVTSGLARSPFPASKLLAAAATLHLPHARAIFARLPAYDVFSFNTMIRAHSLCSHPDMGEVVSLFNSLRSAGMRPDRFSFTAALKCCARAIAPKPGRALHGCLIRSGFESFLNLGNTLVAFYSSCGLRSHAEAVFDGMGHRKDAVSFSALMGGYLQDARCAKVMELFEEMRRADFAVAPAVVVRALSASSDPPERSSPSACEALQGYCVKTGFCLDRNVATSILAMLVRHGRMGSARRVFEEMPVKDVVTWNCMVDGYAKYGLMEESLALLRRMRDAGVKANGATLAGLLSACAYAGAFLVGQRIHGYMEEEGLKVDAILGTALIHMYAGCGRADVAAQVFDGMPDRDVKSWTAMIAGFGVNGDARSALGLLDEMEAKGVAPNEVTFLAALNACSHAGLVVPAKQCLEKMVRGHGLSPGIEHYGCVIDLLGRAGMLEEACDMIESLPIQTDATAWRALLSACRLHGNTDVGEVARRSLMALGEQHPTDLILLSNAYASAGKRADDGVATSLQITRRKEAGCSSVETVGRLVEI